MPPLWLVPMPTEDDEGGGGGLLVQAGCGDEGRSWSWALLPTNVQLARSGPVGSVGAGAGASPGRPVLVTSWAWANGGGWYQAGTRRLVP